MFKNEENEYILLFGIRDIVKKTSHPRQKFIILNGSKKEKSEFKPTKPFAKN